MTEQDISEFFEVHEDKDLELIERLRSHQDFDEKIIQEQIKDDQSR